MKPFSRRLGRSRFCRGSGAGGGRAGAAARRRGGRRDLEPDLADLQGPAPGGPVRHHPAGIGAKQLNASHTCLVLVRPALRISRR